jgi:predicted aldo/keto reductase-like oxidoreductase
MGGAWAELNRSLALLRTDQLDLYQLHAVTNFEELDKAMASGGAIETLVRARDEGLTRYLGITGHGLQAPAVFAEALRRFDFDTVMFPLNPVLYANPDYRREAEALLAMCAEREVGVQIIKAIAKGPWGQQDRRYHTWYEPYEAQERIDEGVRFALAQHPVACIAIAGDTRLLPMVLEAAEKATPMSEAEQAELVGRAQQLEPLFV